MLCPLRAWPIIALHNFCSFIYHTHFVFSPPLICYVFTQIYKLCYTLFPLRLLCIVCHLNFSYSKPSFPFMCPRNITVFIIISLNVALFILSLKKNHGCSHVHCVKAVEELAIIDQSHGIV